MLKYSSSLKRQSLVEIALKRIKMKSNKRRSKSLRIYKPRHLNDFKETRVRKENLSEKARQEIKRRLEFYAKRAEKGLPLFEKNPEEKDESD